MRNKIGFIGIGQAGGNLAELFDKQGYKTMAINTSKEDLDLVNIDETRKYLVPDSSGCNHDRNKSIMYAKKHYKEILDLIEANLGDCDVLIPVFASGGGTGSGMGMVITELLSLEINRELDKEGKILCAVCVLPKLEESVKIQLNAYNCYTKLTSLRNIGSVFTIDNDKGDSTSKAYKSEINQRFVDNFNMLIDMPKHTSIEGNIDEAEIKEILRTRGNTIVTFYKSQQEIANSVRNSIYAELEPDRKVMYIALSLHDDIDISLLESNLGVPYDVFINHNDLDKSIIALSGLSFSQTRVDKMKRKLESSRDHVKGLIENHITNKVEHDLNWLGGDINIKQEEIQDFESIFKEY